MAKFFENVTIKRGETEIISRAQVLCTGTVVGFMMGFILGLVVCIAQFTLDHATSETVANIACIIGILAFIAFMINLLTPKYKSIQVSTSEKIIDTILGLVIGFVMLILGIYVFIFIFCIVVIFCFLWLLSKMGIFKADTSSHNYSHHERQTDDSKAVLEDGTTVYRDSIGGGYSDGFGTHYSRQGDTFTKLD